jgi:predicted transcriptional regulator
MHCVEVNEMGVVKLTVRLPDALHKALKHKAQSEKRSLNQTIVEELWQSVEATTVYETERERTQRVLRESGMLAELGPEWDKYIDGAPDITVEEIREALRGMPPLSEDIIADRGER